MAINEDVSFIEYPVDQPTQDFVTNFDTIGGTTDVVLVTVDGVLTDTPESSYTVQQINHNTWRVTPEVQTGSVVRLYRVTDIDEMMHVFTAGAKFIARNMDENFEQIRHAQQEVRDGFSKLSTDTYEIIDTLEDVAQSAQDAADAANDAAQVANDAAAQVNDKVSQAELDLALDPVKRGIANRYDPTLTYNTGERVILTNGDVVKSTIDGNTVDPNVDMTGWLNPKSRTYYIEEFGASESATPAENSSAFLAALSNLKSGDVLLQTSDVLTIDRVHYESPTDVFNVKFNLKFKFSKSSGVGACVHLSKFKESLINISIDGDNGPASLLLLDECTGSVVPVETELKNAVAIESSADVVAGLFTRDSDEMYIACTIKNITATAGTTKVARGVMISDTFITKNTSYIAPRVINIWKEYGGSAFGADGVYAEHSNEDHAGGLRLQNGYYEDCAQRFFKITMPNPTITGNVGRTTKSQRMYSFASCYKDQAGIIANNNFESVSVIYGIELGVSTQEIKGVISQNRLVTKTPDASSYAVRVSGSMKNVQINLAETSGFSAILAHLEADSALNQVVVLSGSEFDNIGGPNNGITLRGDFKTANVSNISVSNPVAGRYFLTAPEISDGILNIDNVKHTYSFGTIGGMLSRANNLTDGSSTRFESTKMILRRAAIPSSGTYRAGDIIEFTSPSNWVGAVYDGSAWRSYGFINKYSTVTYDPPSIPAGGSVNTTVSLDGATVGSLVQAAFSVYNASIRIYAVVSSFNTVTVIFENTSSSAIDLGEGTLRVKLV